MKALVLTDSAKFNFTTVPIPNPAADEVLIRIKACAICGSDVHGCQGGSKRRIPPIIMGHEASGIIEKLGENVTDYQIGDRVTFDSTEYCGHCDFCQNGMTNLCKNRKIVGVSCQDYKKNGAMAEYITVKAHTLYRIPDSVSFNEACLVEPLSVALHAVNLSDLQKDDTTIIIGDGTIGLMTLQAVRSAGAKKILLIGKHDNRLDCARNYSDVTIINSTDEDSNQRIREAFDNNGANIIFDTVGTNTTLGNAFSYVKSNGKIICIGNASATTNFPLQECIVRQVQVIGSYSSAGEYADALKLIQKGLVDLSFFTQHTWPLSQGAQAFQLLMEKKSDVLKIILTT